MLVIFGERGSLVALRAYGRTYHISGYFINNLQPKKTHSPTFSFQRTTKQLKHTGDAFHLSLIV
jgi:hypothetical protein